MTDDYNGKPGLGPDTIFCGIICAILVVCFAVLVLLFVRSYGS